MSKARTKCLVEIVDCPDDSCYRATAPEGMRLDIGLHELVAPYGNGILGNGDTKAEALAELKSRLPYYTVEVCDDAHCDWCGRE